MAFLDETGLTYLWKKIKLAPYPVGSIYISVNGTSPETLFGGKWESLEYGKVLLSQGGTLDDGTPMFKAGSTGGTPSHQHKYGVASTAWNNNVMAGETGVMAIDWPGKDGTGGLYVHATEDKTLTGATDVSNTGGAKNVTGTVLRSVARTSLEDNYPPYLVVYMWKRIS